MKVTAFVGSARKKHCYHAAERFLKNLQERGGIECEIVQLGEYDLKPCRGCAVCMNKGEEFCPIRDDRDKLIEKFLHSDGVVFVSPNYSFQVSALMKLFLDKLAYLMHRPCMFGKTFTSIVAQGIYGGNKIVDYLNFVGGALGFNLVKGSCIRSLEPMTEKGRIKTGKIIDRQSEKFHAKLIKKEYRVPSLFELMIFRMGRTSRRLMLNDEFRDYTYNREQGWFESAYYYPVTLNPLKKLAGRLFDGIAAWIAGNKFGTYQKAGGI